MLVIGAGYLIFGLSLLLQPRRWSSTPAYHDLLIIMPQRPWGAIFTVTAALLAAAVRQAGPRRLAVTALTVAIMLTTTWAGAFVVRWLTSPNTTPETWVSWLVFDWLLIRSAALLDYEEVRIPRDGPHG
jgi:hypothetical protein